MIQTVEFVDGLWVQMVGFVHDLNLIVQMTVGLTEVRQEAYQNLGLVATKVTRFFQKEAYQCQH